LTVQPKGFGSAGQMRQFGILVCSRSERFQRLALGVAMVRCTHKAAVGKKMGSAVAGGPDDALNPKTRASGDNLLPPHDNGDPTGGSGSF